MKQKQTFKLIVIGPPGVGKSSLVNRYIKNSYRNQYTPTIGVEFMSTLITINEETIKLQIWDTAGQETFRSIIKSFYKNSSAALLVYNIANHQTFEDLELWYDEVMNNCGPDCILGLVGAQKDLQDERKVSIEEAERFAKQKNFAFVFQVSAKINQNVQKLFQETARHVILKKTAQNFIKKQVQLKKMLNEKVEKHKQPKQPKQQEQQICKVQQGQKITLVNNVNERRWYCRC